MDQALPGVGRRADTENTTQLKGWVTAALPAGDERTVLVTELTCTEPGCPPVETVIALIGQGEPQQWKLHKPIAAITEDDVRSLIGT
jgi:hypothetical protein